jgi:hypothetical protein
MPQKDLGDFKELIVDLYRETSRTVFWCIIGGMTVGASAVVYWLVQFYSMALSVSMTGYQMWQYALLVIPAAIVGGIVGCFFGVVIEWTIGLFGGSQPRQKQDRRKKWKPHHMSATEPRVEPSTDIQSKPSNQLKRDERYFT